MAGIRAFIAVELTQEILDGLIRIQDELRSRRWADEVRWVRSEGIHLTLKFLGEMPAPQIETIGGVLPRAVAGIHPFTIRAEGLGVFPNWRRPRVIWVGIVGDTQPLIQLQQKVEQAMADLGFESEDRPFSPHLTLGRVNRHAGAGYQRRLGEALRDYAVADVGQMQVQEVSLMRSQLNPKGAIYTRLGTYPLQ